MSPSLEKNQDQIDSVQNYKKKIQRRFNNNTHIFHKVGEEERHHNSFYDVTIALILKEVRDNSEKLLLTDFFHEHRCK